MNVAEPIASIAWAGRPGGTITVVLGRHDPRVRWGYYDPDGHFVRELAADEVPEHLWTSSRIAPRHPCGGRMLIDLLGGIYLAVLADGREPLPERVHWQWV